MPAALLKAKKGKKRKRICAICADLVCDNLWEIYIRKICSLIPSNLREIL